MANTNERRFPKGLKEIRYPSNDIIQRFTSKDYTGTISLNNETGEFVFNPAISGTDSSSGTSFTTSQASHGFTAGQPIYHDGTEFILANASDVTTLGIWVVTSVTSDDTFTAAQSGRFEIEDHGLTAGSYYFTDVTDGDLTDTEPGVYSNPLIFVESDSVVHVLPFRPSSSTSSGGTGLITSTDDVPEGDVNLYYTEDRVTANAAVALNTAKITYPEVDSTKLATIEESAEVNNITDYNAGQLTDSGDTNIHYHSEDRDRANHTGTQLAATISDLDSAVGLTSAVTLNTSKVSFIDAPIDSIEYARKNGTWVTITSSGITSTDDVPEGTTNLYYTDARVIAHPSVVLNTAKVSFPEAPSDSLYYTRRNEAWESITGVESVSSVFGRTGDVVATTGDYTATQVGLGNVLNVEQVPESEKGVASGVATLGTDGKVPDDQLPASVAGGIDIIGFWDADTNSPDLSALTLTQGQGYQVSVAGTTTLNSISTWALYDLAVWDDSVTGNWFKLTSSGSVTSVNAMTGVVVLDTDDITEATNLYYTETRVDANTNVVANTAKVSADGSIDTHSDIDVSTALPTIGQYLQWDGTNWIPQTLVAEGDMLASVYDPNSVAGDAFDYDNFINTPTTSDDITEGLVNFYYPTTASSKLSGIEEGAEVNNLTDIQAAALTAAANTTLHYHDVDRARANHTGTQTATTVTLDTTNFDNNLDSTITTTQLLADAVDNLSTGGTTGDNDKTKVSATDTLEGYLNTKITVSGSITKTIVNSGADESINFDVDECSGVYDLPIALSDETTELTTDNDVGLFITRAQTISKITAAVNVAPTGSSITVDILKNSVSIATVTILSGALYGETTTISDTSLVATDWLNYDVTAIGGDTGGEGLKIYASTTLTS